ncbi:MAG: 4Fe-4S binding protein [Bacteroidales bacterium]|nr:4Fe-4S binding protein [Bacteroidales bacterium]
MNPMTYSSVTLYYFSGTGNARASANWFAEVAKEQKIDCEVIQLYREIEVNQPVNDQRKQLIGFFFPTHGFNAAPAMLKFIWHFPKIKNASVILVNTRAGMKISKLFAPGLSGLAQILPAIILKAKGFKIVGMQPIDLPSNWISLHPGLKEKVMESIFARCEKITKQFANRILSGGTKYKALISLPIDLAIVPISIGYYFFGRYFLAKTFISTKECNGCEICEQQCPVGAIRMIHERPFWSFHCESCMKCMNNCPKRAIQTAHLYSFILWYLLWFLIPALGLWLAFQKKIIEIIGNEWLATNLLTILLFIISLPVIALAYRLLHYVTRWKWVDDIDKYTSLTFYSFWRRYNFGLKRFRKADKK